MKNYIILFYISFDTRYIHEEKRNNSTRDKIIFSLKTISNVKDNVNKYI